MKIAYTSDIHADDSLQNLLTAQKIAEVMGNADPDVVVLAGDIANTLKTMESVLQYFSGIDAVKLLVPGNHDLWVEPEAEFGEGSDSGEKYASLIPALSSRMGFIDLGHGPVQIGDTAFVGSIGWYDYSFADPLLGLSDEDYQRGRYGDIFWWDHGMISWRRYPRAANERGLSDEEIASGMVEKLEAHIAEADKLANRIVAVIHTCPFVEVFPRSREPNYLDAFQGSERIGEVLRTCKKIHVCVTGHKHQNGDWEINGIRVYRRILGSLSPDDSIEDRARGAVGVLEI